MGNNTIRRQSWTLTLVRDFKSSLDEDIEWEKFSFGRTSDELELEERKPEYLPSGLVYLLDRANLTSQALESGFVTEMCSYPRSDKEWIHFERIATISIHAPFGPTIAHYAVKGGEDSFEMIGMTFGETLPLRLWLRVVELDSNAIAWLIESDLSVGKHKCQTTLDDWYDIGEVTRDARNKPWKRKQLPLPGPIKEPYKFR